MKKTFVKLIALAIVAVMACAAFVSCGLLLGPNADPEKAEEALEKKDYNVLVADDEISLKLYALGGIENLECVITAVSEEDDDDAIVIYYFKDKEAADAAWEEMEDMIEEAKEDEEDLIVKKSGKMIYMGTKAAVNASR